MNHTDECFVGLSLYVLKNSVAKASTASTSATPAATSVATGNGAKEKAKPAAMATTTTAPAAAAEATKPQSFERRDKMREMERKVQQIWEEERTFQVDAEEDETKPKEKFFCTFPYPYMNGKLHLGHGFTVTKADFQAGYQRLKGKKVLFPFAFHCTGMPISAAATKLRRELENPVKPAQQDDDEASQQPAAAPVAASTAQQTDPTKFVSKKTKILKKTGTAKTQSEILLQSGIPAEEIPKFVDPYYWLDYFPPRGEEDLKHFGLLCDWRRSFITTDANPYYDAFIRWQFRTLYKRGKLRRGKRPTICTPDDGQACADHDRSEGEGVQYQEYTLVKMKVVQAPKKGGKLAEFMATQSSMEVFLVPATLRPETMFGQTNCYVLPTGEYGLYRVSPTEIFVCGEHAAKNLAFQGFPKEDGTMDLMLKVSGLDLIGSLVKAPLAVHDHVYVLPMETVSMQMGTAVVTSVPSDSPDDYMTYTALKNSDKFRTQYGVDPDWVKLDIVHIIDIPGYDNRPAAPAECEKLKIKSPKDHELLEKAKGEVYLQGFDHGVMRAETCSAVPGVGGVKVKDAKPIVRQFLLDQSLAVKYYEPAKYVESRSGLECIVKHLDQWYLPYGEEDWKQTVKSHVLSPSTFSAYTPLALKQYEHTLEWLKEWACSRSFGLGTRLPAFTANDREGEFVIESLSDSTIYMAYYTIAHLLQGGPNNYTGKKDGEQKWKLQSITPEVLSKDEVWDFIFKLSETNPYPADSEVGKDLVKLRKEFAYWYPLDLRVSGKDLIQNHLTMSLYNHTAIWQDKPEMWPKSFFTNGHILVESEKMAKSVGNFIMLSEATRGQRSMTIKDEVKMIGWTADATRVALADGGDGLEDANFSCDVADNAVLRLFSETRFAEQQSQQQQATSSASPSPLAAFQERIFQAQMDEIVDAVDGSYSSMRYRDALKHGMFQLSDARDLYRKALGLLNEPVNAALIDRFVLTHAKLIAPICPHFSENVYRNILKISEPKSVFDAGWPEKAILDTAERKLILKKFKYVQDLEYKCRHSIDKAAAKAKGVKPKGVTIGIAQNVPEYLYFTCEFLRGLDQNLKQADAMQVLNAALRADPSKAKWSKDVMKTAPALWASAHEQGGEGLAAYDTVSAFDEHELLIMYQSMLLKLLDPEGGQIQVDIKFEEQDSDRCVPGKPLVSLMK